PYAAPSPLGGRLGRRAAALGRRAAALGRRLRASPLARAILAGSSRPASAPAGPAAPAPRPPANFAMALLRAGRPKQWTKNVLVFAGPGAAGVLFHGRPFLHALAAFALFCAVSSGTYLLNDALDVAADRQHPVKRHRPVASGAITVPQAFAVAAALMAAGIGLGAALRLQLGLVLGVYVVLQVAYSSYLKHLPVYDITCVAGGFLLRAIAGAVAIPVAVSEWFLIVTTFGSLLMVTGKRLAEHAELGEGRGGHRATLDAYSSSFLRIVVAMSATGAIVGYSLWAFGLEAAAVAVHHHDGIFFQLSIVPVLLALLHFTLQIEQGKGARPEELVLGDHQLQLLGAVWILLFALGVYG
ncbi:MAG TPA: decaprenyl-phosphate phosphoribosyltransferase, partial [Acidimicrobiales bacterium]|nr:decaprenyl-phosphate phosphoribosyltransferase [Acidimicrobiales bacterium]